MDDGRMDGGEWRMGIEGDSEKGLCQFLTISL